MHLDVIDVGFPVLKPDGITKGTTSTTHKAEILKPIRRYNFPTTSFGSSSADTASEIIDTFEDPFIDDDHWP